MGLIELKNIIQRSFIVLLLVFCVFAGACDDDSVEAEITEETEENPPILVEKTNDTKLYMHYMPWFHSKEFSGYWGSHWKMGNKNPDNINGDQHEIAAHFYPLIGPYDSGDPDVVQYHLLLMKYAGIDGVLIDWYGSHNLNDYGSNLKNSNALIDGLTDVGLGFAVVYEEYTAENAATRKGITPVEAAQADMTYLETEYFSNPRHITIDDEPLLMTFGPRYFKTPSQWPDIFSVFTEQPKFLPLWGHGGYVGTTKGGEFSWVDFKSTFADLKGFYTKKNQMDVLIGSAYPGFEDYYKEGGWGDSYGYVNHLDGYTMKSTLSVAKDADLDFLQLVTWNDFGEGTMIEPTKEFGYKFLTAIQEFAGVSYGEDELAMVHEYYLKRKEFDGDETKDAMLDEVFIKLNELDVAEARSLLDQL